MTHQLTCILIRRMVLGLLVWAGIPGDAASGIPLSPAAQEAVNKGKSADEKKDYLGAIDHFREALRLAPNSPEVLFRLGKEESRIPGRELRAMAWLGAYLTARPDAPDIDLINSQIGKLKTAHRQTLSRLIKAMEAAAKSPRVHSLYMAKVAEYWAEIGDLQAAWAMAAFIDYLPYKDESYAHIANAQATSGDVPGAAMTIDLIKDADKQFVAQNRLVQVQAEAGDIKGAQHTWALMAIQTEQSWAVTSSRPSAASAISKAQTKVGDRTGARNTMRIALKRAQVIHTNQWDFVHADMAEDQARDGDFTAAHHTVSLMKGPQEQAGARARIAEQTAKAGHISKALALADSIPFEYEKDLALAMIAEAQAKRGDLIAAKKTAGLIGSESDRAYARKAIVKAESHPGDGVIVADWLECLDGDSPNGGCPLKIPIFLDQAAYLKTLPLSDDPEKLASAILEPISRMLSAQSSIERLLMRAMTSKQRSKLNRVSLK